MRRPGGAGGSADSSTSAEIDAGIPVSDWIRDRRRELALTQAKLGARIGVSQVQISCWETRKHSPSPAQLAELITVLGAGVPPPARPPEKVARATLGGRVSNEGKLRAGQFVAVENTRDGVAKLVEVHGSDATVEYFDSVASRIRRDVPVQTLRVTVLSAQTRCYWLHEGHWKIGRIRERVPDGYLVVSQQITHFIAEAALFVRWARPLVDPTEVLATRGNESPLFHRSRLGFVQSVLAQRAASRGLTGVLSSRTELHCHQVETARRVLEDPIPRYILADEVGLGKTIEAGFVIRQFLLDTPGGRVSVLVPPFLVRQWQEELQSKFHVDDFGTACSVESYTDEAWSCDAGVDLLVIDEAHHLAACAGSDVASERRLYARAARVAAGARRLLLLSATPLLHNEATFLAMLHLVDAATYPLDGLPSFRARVAARACLGRVLLGFTEDTPTFLLDQPLGELRALFPHDARLMRLVSEVEASVEGPDEMRAPCIRAVRVHLSETHRIYRRLLRTRRSDDLAETFPVRGRSGARVVLAPDDDRIAADALLEQWRETVLLDAATEPDTSARRSREAALARVFESLLPRACSSVPSLVAAMRYRVRGDAADAMSIDLTPAEAMSLRGPPVSADEYEIIERLLKRFDEFGPDVRAGQIAALVEGRPDCKAVIFASYLHVASALHAGLAKRLGGQVVARHTADMSPAGVEAEVARFRGDARCRVLVCDPSGEEGRNLQFADVLVHYDLSWSPNRLEQRLGRLDRYGEGATVECVVFSDTREGSTFHDRWCRSLSEDFQLFGRSVAAFQFAIDELMPRAWDALFQEGAASLDAFASEIGLTLATEAQAIAEQDVLDSVEAVDRDTGFFDELEECDRQDSALRLGFDGWAGVGTGEQASLQVACSPDARNPRVVEYRPILQPGSRGQTLVPADWLLRWFPTGKPLRATFGRNTAIRNSDARLMRIGSGFYDQVRAFSEWDDRGRAFALWRFRRTFVDRDPDWAFRFDYIVEGDPEPAMRVCGGPDDDPAARTSLQRRLDGLLPPFFCTIWVDAAGKCITDPQRLGVLEEPYDKRAGDVNLRPGRFERVDHLLGLGEWAETCRRFRQRSELVLREADIFTHRLAECAANAERLIGSRVEMLRARGEREGASTLERDDAEREHLLAGALLTGIRVPHVRLEAIGFVCLAGMALPDQVGNHA